MINESELKEIRRATFLHIVLSVLALTLVLPFIWMLLTSLKPLDEVDEQNWLPSAYWSAEEQEVRSDGHTNWESSGFQWGNYREVFDVIPFGTFYHNSLFIAAWVTFLQVFTSALAAFSFARLDWPGRDKVFMLYLGTMMLPGLVMMIPNYQIMIHLGLVDTFAGLILPAAFSAFGTFLIRQFMLTIPKSLDEAAYLDGASSWQLFWSVILPISRPGLVTLTIFTFMGNYNSFFWPLVMLKSESKYTLPIGLLYFDSSRGTSTHLMMAAVAMSVIPMIIVFVVLQKHLVRGIAAGAVKG